MKFKSGFLVHVSLLLALLPKDGGVEMLGKDTK